MAVKCFKCKEQGEKELMVCVEKGTGKFNKNGTEKKIRKYFHQDCHHEFLLEQELKEKELKELDALYMYLLKLHSIELLDGRMMEKIQDLRNGTIKINNNKIKKYKQGVPYSLMLDTYKYLSSTIDNILRTMYFQAKWNEFSYIFGTMVKSINDMKKFEKHVQEINEKPTVNVETVDIQVKKTNKKDELDISAFL